MSARRVVLVTGMSGAGKTSALKALEDLDFEAVDNVPLSLFQALVIGSQHKSAKPSLVRPLAIGADIRTRDFGVDAFIEHYDELTSTGGIDVKTVFMDCDDEELRRRYEETRHRHPLAIDRPVTDGIAKERGLVTPLRDRADLTIDTTGLAPGELKSLLGGNFGAADIDQLVVSLTSFAYRRGIPRDSDLVFDVRFLANPYYAVGLKDETGRSQVVADFIEADTVFQPFFDNLTGLLALLLPRYSAEGKSYLTIALGCTGGHHRSVFVAERLRLWFEGRGERVRIRHRELVE